MEPIKFIHAADLHLDSPMVGLKDLPDFIFERLKESTFRSFIKLIDVAISEKVDFVILAGDLYDASDRSIKAQNILREQMLRLHKARIRAFIVHGNHDHLGGEWIKLTMPENVFIFGEIPEVTRFKKTIQLFIFMALVTKNDMSMKEWFSFIRKKKRLVIISAFYMAIWKD